MRLASRRAANYLEGLSLRIRSRNTSPITRAEYATCFQSWGGSFILHPEVLRFFEDNYGIKATYYGYFTKGECVGAVAAWGAYVAGDRNALRAHRLTDQIDFGFPILYLPIAPSRTCRIFFRASFLLAYQQKQIKGACFTDKRQMAILKRVPAELSSGKRAFLRMHRQFQRLGGVIRNIRDISTDEIVTIYEELHRARWRRKPHAISSLAGTLKCLRTFLFGNVLCINDRPVAIQINFSAETDRLICIDAVTGASERSINSISCGSLLLYINGQMAWNIAESSGKRLIYSYGRSGDRYKDQWCNRVARGSIGCIVA
jgi:hypothetical protein